MNALHGVSTRTVFQLFEASWQAAVLAALVVVLCLLLRDRLSARWRCALWLVVVARLFSLDQLRRQSRCGPEEKRWLAQLWIVNCWPRWKSRRSLPSQGPVCRGSSLPRRPTATRTSIRRRSILPPGARANAAEMPKPSGLNLSRRKRKPTARQLWKASGGTVFGSVRRGTIWSRPTASPTEFCSNPRRKCWSSTNAEFSCGSLAAKSMILR